MGKTAKKTRERRGRLLQKQIEAQKEAANTQQALSQMKDEELFEVTEKSKAIRKKRYPLDPQRFKRKMWKFLGKSHDEARMISSLARKMVAEKKIPKKQSKKDATDEMVDLWAEEPTKKAGEKSDKPKYEPRLFRSMLPAVALPHAGQSYNPAADDYKVNFAQSPG